MAQPVEISVVVVSRDRPDDLRKVLSCLQFQDISGYEVIVVTNTPSAVEGTRARLFDCDEANISVARNVGLHAAKGRVIAYCDDDALPDPSWLRHLLGPFKDPDIGGTGGFTRGRNGISLQWGGVETDTCGESHPLDISAGSAPVIFAPAQKTAPVMIGTNCAFRVAALKQIGGFDPAFAYYLDDSDISLRLSQAGWHLAIVPQAQVHHGFTGGPYRQVNRVPKTLYPHGVSKAVFCRKHAREGQLAPALRQFEKLQFTRLEKQMLAGLMEPPTLPDLIETLKKGYEKGQGMALSPVNIGPHPPKPAPLQLSSRTLPHFLLAGSPKDKAALERLGKAVALEGGVVTVLILSRSPAYMQIGFSADGYWLHSGGQYGKSDRTEPLFQRRSFKQKVQLEVARLRPIRPVSYVVTMGQPLGGDIILPQIHNIACLNGLVVESVYLSAANSCLEP
jgi:hypothetical protein